LTGYTTGASACIGQVVPPTVPFMTLELTPEQLQELSERVPRLAAGALRRLEAGPIQPALAGAGLVALRACIVNHRTTDDEVEAVVDEVLAAARHGRGHGPMTSGLTI